MRRTSDKGRRGGLPLRGCARRAPTIRSGEGGVVDAHQFGIGELAEEAGVSVRTVRYYIAEGLLPPPVVAGARSHYTRAHLDRLRLIGHLKAAYLPLREIRRRLDALDEGQVALLAA